MVWAWTFSTFFFAAMSFQEFVQKNPFTLPYPGQPFSFLSYVHLHLLKCSNCQNLGRGVCMCARASIHMLVCHNICVFSFRCTSLSLCKSSVKKKAHSWDCRAVLPSALPCVSSLQVNWVCKYFSLAILLGHVLFFRCFLSPARVAFGWKLKKKKKKKKKKNRCQNQTKIEATCTRTRFQKDPLSKRSVLGCPHVS